MTIHRFISCVAMSSGVAMFGCDPLEVDEGPPADALERSPSEVEDMARDLADLAELEGEDIDDLRRSLPVPAVFLDLYPDGTLAVPQVERTSPGLPAALAGRDVWSAAPSGDDGAPHAVEAPLSPRTVFGPDGRYNFYDTSYPFSTTGKIESPRGVCTGTMVGSRHVLTASHCIQWNADNTTGWVRFRPMAYDNTSPFGEAWGTLTYSYRQVPGPAISHSEIAFDFVVVVLDRHIGNATGSMGSRTYTSAWNNAGWWGNVGYPTMIGGSMRPAFQNGCSITSVVDQCWTNWCSLQLLSHCDITPGNSGGPLWASWTDGPSVVAVASAEDPSNNHFAGGALLPTIIQHARNTSP